MSFNTCPIATIDAPVERVWDLLANPARYAEWWDAETRSIVPEGPARPGQQILAQSVALGMHWNVEISVRAIDPNRRTLDLVTRLPFRITAYNHIVCAAVDDEHTRVSFG
jgi:ligand-binding SRPBCC domain-containing protein